MFCYQCEQTFRGEGCVDFGVCGKSESSSDLQDLIIYSVKGIAVYQNLAKDYSVKNKFVYFFIFNAVVFIKILLKTTALKMKK